MAVVMVRSVVVMKEIDNSRGKGGMKERRYRDSGVWAEVRWQYVMGG